MNLANRMSRHFKITLALLCLTALLGIAGISYFLKYGHPTYARHERFLCSHCAADRVTFIKSCWGIPVKWSATISPTQLTEVLKFSSSIACDHEWVLYKFGVSRRSWGTGTHGSGSGKFSDQRLLEYLVTQKGSAEGIVKYAERTGRKPSAVWHHLLTRLEAWPKGKDHAFYAWYWANRTADADAFSKWLEDNFESFPVEANWP
jgi:hypothetical protein